ncbi:MAG: argininosuccinate lyase [Terriglobia bacterium]|jgi:argininosuccinate lyase
MKLWGGRFTGRRDPLFEKFSESFSLDQRFIRYDLRVNLAWVKELGRLGVFKPAETRRLARGLEAIRRSIERNPHWAQGQSSEDVHTWVEAQLERRIGPLAGKLRTGRSRNDLVATEARLYIKDAIGELERALADMLEALLGQARRQTRVVMPGYTHLQPAQPILFAHYALAYFQMFWRDAGRLEDCRERADELPMGAGALAGTGYRLDRELLARALGFARAASNSLDVTSDRDFVAELLFACSLMMVHLSRWAEDLIIYSSPGFGFVELADAYATGSSLMPQKKNPDALELIRGKAATVLGRLTGMLALVKGLPLAYDRDLQEDKGALFSSVDTTREALTIASRVAQTLRIYPERMKAATAQGFLTATDLADELVRRGVPFAEAHEQVGKLVRFCAGHERTFADLGAAEAQRFIPSWDSKLRRVAVSPESAVKRRNVFGGTAPQQVARQIATAQGALAKMKKQLARRIFERERDH